MFHSLIKGMDLCTRHADAIVTMDDVRNPHVGLCDPGQYHFQHVLMSGRESAPVSEIMSQATIVLKPHDIMDIEMMRRIVLVCMLAIRRDRAESRN